MLRLLVEAEAACAQTRGAVFGAFSNDRIRRRFQARTSPSKAIQCQMRYAIHMRVAQGLTWVCFVVVAVATAAEWNAPLCLSPGSTDAFGPAVAGDESGVAHVVYRVSNQQLRYVSSSAPGVTVDLGRGVQPRITAGQGTVTVVYSNEWEIWSRQRSGGTWQTPVNVSRTGSGGGQNESTAPDIAQRADGRLFIVWIDTASGQGEIWFSEFVAGMYSAAMRLSETGVNGYAPPAVAAAPDGRPVIVYGSGPTTAVTLHLLWREGTTWRRETLPFAGGVRCGVTVDEDGDFQIAWERNEQLWVVRRTEAGPYSTPQVVSTGGGAYAAGIVGKHPDAVWVVWRALGGTGEGLVRRWLGTAWDVVVSVSAGQQVSHLASGAGPHGQPLVVWSQDWQIWLAARAVPLPTSTPNLTPSRTPTRTPTITPVPTATPTLSETPTNTPRRTVSPSPPAEPLAFW